MTTIDSTIFRAYDIRGIVDEDLTEETVLLIGQSIGSEAKTRGEQTLIIARDGRLSGPRLSKALCDGLLKSGCNVIDIGAVPTPLLYFATHILGTRSGVVLTGSHNPANYNGIKVVLGGETLCDKAIYALYERIIENKLTEGSGTLEQTNIIERYIDRIVSDVKPDRPLKIVIDCGNGIGGIVAPLLFRRLGCEVIELFCEVDGHFPNHHPDPSIPKNLKDLIEMVQERNADIGLAFDGDADRLGVVTNTGTIILPDRQIMLFVKDILSRNPKAPIIYDVKCSRHLQDEIIKHGGEPIMYKTGHSFIKNKMIETNAPFGGEMSGHIFFKERWYGFDDGLYAGCRLLELLSKQMLPSDDLFKTFPDSVNTPELKIHLTDDETKFAFMKEFKRRTVFENAQINTIDGLRVDFEKGWGLVRPSNTTPALILRFEAENAEELQSIQALFRKALLAIDSSLKLPF